MMSDLRQLIAELKQRDANVRRHLPVPDEPTLAGRAADALSSLLDKIEDGDAIRDAINPYVWDDQIVGGVDAALDEATAAVSSYLLGEETK